MRLDHLLSKEHLAKDVPVVGMVGLEPFHRRTRGGGAHGWKHRRFFRSRQRGAGGTLLGPEGTAREGCFFGSGSRPGGHTADPVRVRAGGPRRGLGFGGVFVNWIVDASI